MSTAAEIVRMALDAHLHGLCLTDHHRSDAAETHEVAAALRAVGILPIVGAEYSTADGHLLIYGVEIPRGIFGMYPDMQEVVDWVAARGGACVTPHPYKGYTRALHDRVKIITGLAAVEVWNQHSVSGIRDVNRLALQAAREMGIPMTAASDAHSAHELGTAYTAFSGIVTTEAEFIQALKSGKFKPVRNTRLQKRRNKLVRRKPSAQPAWFLEPGAPPWKDDEEVGT